MAFDVAGGSYQRFMGRFSEKLSAPFADYAGVASGMRVLDVGCGPGALTAVLVDRLGASAVAGVDPSEPFVAAVRERLPDVDIRQAPAEALPFDDDSFDAALAQLVVHFMTDAPAGAAEMVRVTRPGGPVAVCVWDHAGGRGPLSLFWEAVAEVDPGARDEAGLLGSTEGQLEELLESAGLTEVEGGTLTVTRAYTSFEDWWDPYTLGVGPAGDYVRTVDDATRDRVIAACRSRLPEGEFTLDATCWTARGTVAR
ncbi:MAG TPA: methyltransferase domain-containing protein [Lapillicoccus sp.]|nr:methyltransferase domain-containing protein [Lapillicoccus sp.]